MGRLLPDLRHLHALARSMLVPQTCQFAHREDNMRRSDLYVGALTFVAIALAMPLAALEPITLAPTRAETPRTVADGCGSKLATLCDRAA
jgi:hypothetical protein